MLIRSHPLLRVVLKWTHWTESRFFVTIRRDASFAASAEFMARNPEIRIDLHVTAEIVDLVADGFDVAMWLCPKTDPDMIVRRLGGSQVIVVAAPELLAGGRRRGNRRIWRPPKPPQLVGTKKRQEPEFPPL